MTSPSISRSSSASSLSFEPTQSGPTDQATAAGSRTRAGSPQLTTLRGGDKPPAPPMVVTRQRSMKAINEAGAWQNIANTVAARLQIVVNQAYEDGNHRACMFQIYKTASEHGMKLNCEPRMLYGKIDELYARKMSGKDAAEALDAKQGELAKFVRRHMRPEPSGEALTRHLSAMQAGIEALPGVLEAQTEKANRFHLNGKPMERSKARQQDPEAWRAAREEIRPYQRIHDNTTKPLL